jgi:hypothetical protein
MRAAIVAAVLLWSGVAAADPLTLTAPEECGGVDDLRNAIERDAGFPLTEILGLLADVVIEHDELAVEYRATLQITTGEGTAEREVRAHGCEAVLDAASFVIALAMQKVRGPVPPTSLSDELAAGIPTPKEYVETTEPVVVPVREAPPRVGVRAGLDLRSALGSVPGIGLGGAGTVAVERRAASIEAGFEAYLPTRADAPGDGMAGADVRLLALRLRGCGELAEWRVCGGGAVGRLHGQGVGLTGARGASRRWSAIVAALAWRRPLGGRFALVVELEAEIGVERPRFTLDDGTLLFQPAPAAGRLAVGLELRLR